MTSMEHLKAVVVGDGTVGKTCMLVSYTDNRFSADHIPTVFDNYSANVMLDRTVIHLDLWDTAGQEDYDGLRPLSYPASDVFILCFSLISRTSLANAQSKWAPELRAYDKRNGTSTPIILIGTKSDLRDDPESEAARNGMGNHSGGARMDVVSHAEGLSASEKMGCSAYVECSAITQDGLKLAFDSAIRHGLRKKMTEREGHPKDKACMAGCSIM